MGFRRSRRRGSGGSSPGSFCRDSAPPGWTFQFTPYGWLTGLRGTQTVRGRSVKVNASFIDIFNDTAGQGGTLIGLMGDFEARKGPFSLYGDVVWSKLGAERSHVSTRSAEPGIAGPVGRTVGLDIEMAIVEGGATYELARVGSLAFDALGGIRYWHQQADLSFERTQTFDVADLEVNGTRAIAASASFDWVDPFVGARLRYMVAPGHSLFLRGDIGGFGVGSSFSWQAVGGYSFDFATANGVTYSGVIGYRALYVDYAHGEGRHATSSTCSSTVRCSASPPGSNLHPDPARWHVRAGRLICPNRSVGRPISSSDRSRLAVQSE